MSQNRHLMEIMKKSLDKQRKKDQDLSLTIIFTVCCHLLVYSIFNLKKLHVEVEKIFFKLTSKTTMCLKNIKKNSPFTYLHISSSIFSFNCLGYLH